MERLDLAFEALKKLLFGRLHDITKKQLFGNAERLQVLREDYALPKQGQNGTALASQSKAMRSRIVVLPNPNKVQIFKLFDKDLKLKIAIIRFGNFGQFLAKAIARQGHTVLAYSRKDYSDVAEELGVYYFTNADDLYEEDPEVMLLCMSIRSTKKVLRSLLVQRLRRNTLFVDALSEPINIKGYETLLNLVENTAGDNFDLYYGLFTYNIYVME